MRLKILSWNIWIDGHFDQITELLSASKADIIALQEVKDDDPKIDVIRYLKELGYQYVFASVQHIWDGKVYRHGPAVFSRHEIRDSRVYMLSAEDPRAAVRADISIEGELLHVFGTHLTHTHQKPSEVQDKQVENLLRTLPSKRTIVMGDFNATPESSAIEMMSEALKDADSSSAPTWSVYPEGCGVCRPQARDTRLDYIFTTKDINVNSFRVEESKGSDHLPISATIEI